MLNPLISHVQSEASSSAQRHHLNNLARKGRGSSKPETNSQITQRGIARRSRYYLCGTIFLVLFFSIANASGGHEAGIKATLPGPIPTVVGDSSFSYSSQWGSYGGPIMPNGVTVDPSGNVYIADAKNYAIVKLARDGSFVTSWGSYGTGPGQFRNPEGVALDASGNVYVTDSVNNNLEKFTNAGIFITSWSTWNTTNVLRNPIGLSVNATGFVYVADQGNQRVEIFRSDGTYVS